MPVSARLCQSKARDRSIDDLIRDGAIPMMDE